MRTAHGRPQVRVTAADPLPHEPCEEVTVDHDEHRAATTPASSEIPAWYAAAIPALLTALVAVMVLASHTATA